MKSSIFIVLGLLLVIHYSNSFPQLAEIKSKKAMSCGKIRTCLKPACFTKNICKNAPQKLPPRCSKPPPTPPACSPKNLRKGRCPTPPVTPVDKGCKCLSKELDGAGLPIGHCLTKDPANDKFIAMLMLTVVEIGNNLNVSTICIIHTKP